MKTTALLLAWMVTSFCISTTLGASAEHKPVLQPAYIEPGTVPRIL